MRALEYTRSVPRFVLVRALAGILPGIATSPLGPLRLRDLPEPALPGADWVRLRPRLSGICGSDLATIACRGSYYFSALLSFPFVLGHEVVADVTDAGPAVRHVRAGDRVVLEPALGCLVRGISPLCGSCREGNAGNCVNVTAGCLPSGIQTGYCRGTGGGWSESLVAHSSQVHPVPPPLCDEVAVLVEPLACALHAVLRAGLTGGECVLVLGAGSVGLLTLTALRALVPGATVWVAAKHPHQAEAARALGADAVLPAGRALRAGVVERTGARVHHPTMGDDVVLGGVDATFDCVGSGATLDEAVRLTRARGTVVVVGMPAVLEGIEGTALWYKETRVLGAYAYGLERVGASLERTFAIALDVAARRADALAPLVTGRFGLAEYGRAIRDASDAGRARSVKTVLDPRRP